MKEHALSRINFPSARKGKEKNDNFEEIIKKHIVRMSNAYDSHKIDAAYE
jgi:hypothetical protein